MIEKKVLDYLNETLSVPAYMEKPSIEPVEYVLIEKTGSAKENHIESANIALQAYADSLYNAALLNEEVKEKMDIMADQTDIFSSRLLRDYNFTDTTKKKYRYQAIYELVF